MPETTAEPKASTLRLPLTAPPQIVVNTLHRRLVEDRIQSLFQITPTEADIAPELDLVLLDLDLDNARGPFGGPVSLDGLLFWLYQSFRFEFNGWAPTFGKNRDVSSIVAQNTIDGGAEGGPRPATAAVDCWAVTPSSPGKGVHVGVADTAVAERPQFDRRLVAGPDSVLTPGSTEPPAEAGHGTFVTGLVLEAAPAATVHAHAVLDEHASGTSWKVARAMVQLAREGVQVLNLSLGCHTADDQPPLVFQRALARLGSEVVVVAAAGNFKDGEPRKPVWPAALDDVVAVGATGEGPVRRPYSPDPAQAPWVDVQAPGDDVLSVFLDEEVLTRPDPDDGGAPVPTKFAGFARWSGTSFAAAHLSGCIAAAMDPGRVSASEALADVLEAAESANGLIDGRPWVS